MIKIDCLKSKLPYGSNCYVLESNGEYAIVDPSVSYSDFSNKYGAISERIKYIFITHAHFDHILEIEDWTSRDVTVIVGDADASALSDPDRNCYRFFFGLNRGFLGQTTSVKNGDILTLGGAEIEIVSTPGHTPGGISLYFEGTLVVGDTVFADGGYGRCDLPGGNMNTLFSTIKSLIQRFEDGVTVYPGHGRSTSIGEIKRYF